LDDIDDVPNIFKETCIEISVFTLDTVDERNPALPGMYETLWPYEYWDIDPTSPGFLAGFLVAINSSNPLKTAPLSIYNHFPANVR